MNPTTAGAALAAPFGLILSTPLALIALGTIPLIVVLHSLTLRWKNLGVSSLLFWDAVLREKKTSMRLRRILRSLMLLAQLFVAALLALALTQPLLSQSSLSGKGNVILVMDETASMKTREGPRQRFDLGKGRALDLLPGLRRGSRMCLIAAARTPALVVPFTEDKERLRRAIQGLRATDEWGDMRESVLFALSLRDAKRDDRVVIITDGAFDSLGDLDAGEPWISLIRVGESRRNAGITALALRKIVGPDEEYEMFVNVKNFSRQAMSFPLTITAGRTRVYDTEVSLTAGEERGFSMPYSGPLSPSVSARSAGQAGSTQTMEEGRITAEIGTSDDLPTDNRSYAVLQPARGIRVLIVGQENFFLKSALTALPNVTIGESAPEALGRTLEEDVVVFDGGTLPPLEKGNYILIGAVPPNLPLKVTGVLQDPRITAWKRGHPLLSSISPESISIRQALKVEAQGCTTLLQSGNNPIMLICEWEGLKVLFIGFSMDDSDLPLRPAFPVLLANALEWFSPGWLSVQAEQIQAGDPKEISISRSAVDSGPVLIQRPDGTREVLPETGAPPSFLDTSEVGFYGVTESGLKTGQFAVTLSSPEESDITPRYRFESASAGETGDAREAAGASLTPLWGALAIAAAALILAEWLLVVREKR
jgi:hypothetical protein